jgi:hypothetical protein
MKDIREGGRGILTPKAVDSKRQVVFIVAPLRDGTTKSVHTNFRLEARSYIHLFIGYFKHHLELLVFCEI